MSDQGPVESPSFGPHDPAGGHKGLAVLGVVGAVALVVGVGAALSFTVFDGDGEYCALLDDSTERFGPLFMGGPSFDHEDRIDAIHDLREAAPSEIAEAWAQLDDPLQEFQTVLDEADATWQDLESVDALDPAVADGAERLDLALRAHDARPITHHAEDVCGLSLMELYG
jgi:hypothetical protein